jgi:predicted metalloprotease
MGQSRLPRADARKRGMGTNQRRLLAAATACATLALAVGCGSSSHSTSTSTSSASTSSSASGSTTTGQTTSASTSAGASASAGSAKTTDVKGIASTGTEAPAKATLAALPKASQGLTPHIQGVSGQPLAQQITTIDNNIDSFWGQLFNKAGLQWPSMQQAIIANSPMQTSDCGNSGSIAPTDPWRLCDSSNGGTFYFPLTWISQNVATDQGGVNLLLGMAELWSNHVENLLGITSAAENGKISPAAYAEINVCLAGVYTYSINEQKLFEAGDQQTFQNWYSTMSPEFTDVSPQNVSTQQLQQAFNAGFQSGNPGTCLGSNGSGGGQQTTPQTTPQPPATQTQPSGGGGGGGGGTTVPLGSSGSGKTTTSGG